MRIVGLAGASGTGKSTIAAHLTMRGGVHVDADIIAHDILAHDADVQSAIREAISADVFADDGQVDRRRLGAIVFRDKVQLRKLNEITHPAIRKRCGRIIKELKASGVPFAVVDAALLLESRMPFKFDLMIALTCHPEAQYARLMAKGGRTDHEVRRRIESQKHIRDSFAKADVVVDTSRPKAEVFAQIDALIDDLLARVG